MPHKTKAIITGHSRGLGRALAETLLEEGIPVLGLARRGAPEIAARYAGGFRDYPIDLCDLQALAAWLESPEIDEFCSDAETILLINNAGMLGPVGPLDSQPAVSIAQAVALNVAAPLMLASTLARHHRGELRVLHISSGAARSPYAGWSVYCATKAALDQHARAVAADGGSRLRICSLAPGVVDTDMQIEVRATGEDRFPMRKRFEKLKQDGLLTPPREAARKIVAYLSSESFGKEAINDIRDLHAQAKA